MVDSVVYSTMIQFEDNDQRLTSLPILTHNESTLNEPMVDLFRREVPNSFRSVEISSSGKEDTVGKSVDKELSTSSTGFPSRVDVFDIPSEEESEFFDINAHPIDA